MRKLKLEISKQYGSADSGSFVNGVLDAVREKVGARGDDEGDLAEENDQQGEIDQNDQEK